MHAGLGLYHIMLLGGSVRT